MRAGLSLGRAERTNKAAPCLEVDLVGAKRIAFDEGHRGIRLLSSSRYVSVRRSGLLPSPPFRNFKLASVAHSSGSLRCLKRLLKLKIALDQAESAKLVQRDGIKRSSTVPKRAFTVVAAQVVLDGLVVQLVNQFRCTKGNGLDRTDSIFSIDVSQPERLVEGLFGLMGAHRPSPTHSSDRADCLHPAGPILPAEADVKAIPDEPCEDACDASRQRAAPRKAPSEPELTKARKFSPQGLEHGTTPRYVGVLPQNLGGEIRP